MICIYAENCTQAGHRAYHRADRADGRMEPSDDPSNRKRTCPNGDHMRVLASRIEARRFEKMAATAQGGHGAFLRRVAQTIRETL